MLKLGVIGNEFFDQNLGRMGGFGWATRLLADFFNGKPELGVEVVFLTGEHFAENGKHETTVHGSRLLLRQKNRWQNLIQTRREKIDLLLLIDYEANYRFYLRALPRTPFIVWARDPHSDEDWERIHTLKIPSNPTEKSQGIDFYDRRCLAKVVKESFYFQRPNLFATVFPPLAEKLEGSYGIEPDEIFLLPNIINLNPSEVVESERPSVVFLGRLDPIKRPWLFVELARRFPEVNFLFLGKSLFQGVGAWQPTDVPPNVKFCGHVGEVEKLEILSQAWVLVNTSIHEGLAVSWQEALACETPILSTVNTGFTVSRYGIYAGEFAGDGLASLNELSKGLQKLLENENLRRSLGKAGRKWVNETHNETNFLESFRKICRRLGIAENKIASVKK